MKKLFFLTALLCASMMSWATQYCDFPTGHENNANFGDANGRILLTLVPTANENEYKLTIKPNYASGATKKLDYLYVIASGNSPYPAEAGSDVTTGGEDELSVTFTNSSATTSFTIQWSHPDWAGRWQCSLSNVPLQNLTTCDVACADAEKPTISSVVVSDTTINSAVLTITGSDNVGIVRYVVKNAGNEIATSTSNVINLSNLNSNTAYSLSVFAYDDCDNASDAFAVNFTTKKISYCEYPTGHLKDANFGDANGRILLTVRKISNNSVGVTVKPNNGGIDVFDYVKVELGGVGKELGTVGGTTPTNTEIVYTDLASLSFSLNIFWHNSKWDVEAGRWTTNQFNVSESELCTESPATAIDNTNADAQAVKVIENGQLVIIKNGVKYNALGAELR